MDVGITEAAWILGVSSDTIRRRLKRGELEGTRMERPQGFVWAVRIDEREQPPMQLDMGDQVNVSTPMQLVEFLQEQLRTKDAHIGQLIHELGELRTDLKMLPPPRGTSWWRRLIRYNPI